MFFKSNPVLVIFVILFFIFNIVHTTSLENEDYIENDPALNTEQSSDEGEDKRAIRIRCYCWIGWVKKKNTKYINFGSIRKFKLFETKKHSKCSASCSKKCAPYLKPNYFNYLCGKIGKKYHYKEHKVGCFSRVGKFDLPNNLWDFDGSPHGLCCKKVMKSCTSVYGTGFYYHSGLKLCIKYLAPGPIPGFSNGTKKPPLCFYWNKLYACQPPKYYTKSVPCW
ncbi:uncharacterized protein LOC116297222 [Actinia tenebrosa]|uniref:Uncharacterized protein LOC116297222 n=1 Tax=Actinia tenebrosa TaxID=6105 RepID=A0A6P8I873_ACTTE|nr:uncharacterized protein LOC116297222 [Actinia tenebrosa]